MERKKKKMRTIKVESEDPFESLAPTDTASAPQGNIINSLPDTPSTPLQHIKEEWVMYHTVVKNIKSFLDSRKCLDNWEKL